MGLLLHVIYDHNAKRYVFVITSSIDVKTTTIPSAIFSWTLRPSMHAAQLTTRRRCHCLWYVFLVRHHNLGQPTGSRLPLKSHDIARAIRGVVGSCYFKVLNIT